MVVDPVWIHELIDKLKVSGNDVPIDNIPSRYDICQPKYDGWWGLGFYNGELGQMKVFASGGGGIFFYKDMPQRDYSFVCVGEAMYGTQWANKPEYVGKFFAHDIVWFNNKYLYEFSYARRRTQLGNIVRDLEHPQFRDVIAFPILDVDIAWRQLVDRIGFEGLVYKDSTATLEGQPDFGRTKKTFTRDYVCTRMYEGAGRLSGKMGSIAGALYKEDELVEVVAVGGGFSDQQREDYWDHQSQFIGKVFEASGYSLFEGGALRHPTFKRWREDKDALACKL